MYKATPVDARPGPAELEAASGRGVPDVIARKLGVLFCGINPGLWSAAVGHHFARPGNRFWKVLHLSGFTDRLLDPSEERSLLEAGVGITNIVERSSRAANDLSRQELRAGAVALEAKVRRWQPAFVAVLGIGAYRAAFGKPKAVLGRQPDRLGSSTVWVLANPSGAQAAYQLPALVEQFSELRRATMRPHE